MLADQILDFETQVRVRMLTPCALRITHAAPGRLLSRPIRRGCRTF